MKEEEKIIKNTIKRTKEYDRTLSPYACKTSECQKLWKEESEHEEFDIRWPFEEDIDRILYCKSYQRYTDKTQALSFFQSAHISKRSIHVQWVSRIARQIGKGLNLNLDLIEAAALGHDLGHAPYGHVGERALNEKLQEKGFGYFCHNANSVRNILYLERNGKGYNVSLQVLDAILCHNGEMLSKKYEPDRKKTKEQFLQEYHDCWHKENASLELKPMTLEGCVVRISDVISYIGKDIEDAMSVGILQKKDLPENVVKVLGDNNKSIMNKLIGDLMIHSYQKPYLRFSHEVFEALSSLLFFLGEKVHHHPVLEKENAKLSRMVKELFDVYLEELENNDQDSNIVKFKNKMVENYQNMPNPLIVSDYLSMMTDTYVLNDYERKFLPILHGEKL